ncbi:MAG: hypothetical protein GF364_11040 [Candidatus Lokiarchaeota archaeon]|nr:hypothetical protein [Candidatus Lokiarchaeota archaeon]
MDSNMDISLKRVAVIQIILISSTLAFFFTGISVIENPEDYRPEKIARSDRKGTIYGYAFLDWEILMPNSAVAEEYMDLAAKSLNCCYVHCKWSTVCPTNDTLNYNYLNNLSLFIEGMAERDVQVVIYAWVSAYSPEWMFEYTPELQDSVTGKAKTCWYGIDPNDPDPNVQEHRRYLKYSMLNYYDNLSQYFIDNGLMDNITGWNLDDETNIDPNSPDGQSYWNDFFTEITELLHAKHADWDVQAMFLHEETYKIAGIAGFDINAFDAYCQDMELIQRIKYSYEKSGVDRCSVLLSAMYLEDDTVSLIRMRRLAWISWFMGVDSVGWYSFYYGTQPDESWTCAIIHLDEDPLLGPDRTTKTDQTEAVARDFYILNSAWDQLESVGRTTSEGRSLEKKLLKSYKLAKASKLDQARDLIEEAFDL